MAKKVSEPTEANPKDQYSDGAPDAVSLASDEKQPESEPSHLDQYGPSGANALELLADAERAQREAANQEKAETQGSVAAAASEAT